MRRHSLQARSGHVVDERTLWTSTGEAAEKMQRIFHQPVIVLIMMKQPDNGWNLLQIHE